MVHHKLDNEIRWFWERSLDSKSRWNYFTYIQTLFHKIINIILTQAIPALRDSTARKGALKWLALVPTVGQTCFKQRLLAAFPRNCLLSIGCWSWTDQSRLTRHDTTDPSLARRWPQLKTDKKKFWKLCFICSLSVVAIRSPALNSLADNITHNPYFVDQQATMSVLGKRLCLPTERPGLWKRIMNGRLVSWSADCKKSY